MIKQCAFPEDIHPSDIFGNFTIDQLSRWLMSKTANNYTLEEFCQQEEAFYTFEDIAERVAQFRKEWKAKFDNIDDYLELYPQSIEIDDK